MHTYIQKIESLGLRRSITWLSVRLRTKGSQLLHIPAWYWFKIQNPHTSTASILTEEDSRVQKERSMRLILNTIENGRFLEIGVGEFPREDRFKLLHEKNTEYVGCDFASVCESHQTELKIKGIDTTRIRFVPNTTGTYAWTLFEMLQKNEQFDVIYVDGHHTFYIDLPAILLADKLLKPGGYLLLDDIGWSLSFLKGNLRRSLSQWYFYRKIYNFSEYTPAQQQLPHIRMIAEELLLKDGRYAKNAELSFTHWWALRKSDS
jgi:SAM-dependent methyltransferase